MAKARTATPSLQSNDIRRIILRYFYDRNTHATSARGKKGSAAKISSVKSELKSQFQLTQQEVQSNLTYLLSQGWVTEEEVEKQFRTTRGTIVPSLTNFYQITAAGIDKIEGEGEFTMPKFNGIKIEATGQNIITLGDGNKINAEFSDLGKSLMELRKAITESATSETDKLSYVADIETIQLQLAKPKPNNEIIKAAWASVKGAAAINGCSILVSRVASYVTGFLS